MKYSNYKIKKKILAGFVLTLGLVMSASASQAKGFDALMQSMMTDYLMVQKHLADDKTEGVNKAGERMHSLSMKLKLESAPKKFQNHYKNMPSQMMESSKKLQHAKNIKEMRAAFKGLSMPMANWTEMHQPKGMGVYYCSMAKGSWVQKEGSLKNPYYGHSMLGCGERVKHQKKDHAHKH